MGDIIQLLPRAYGRAEPVTPWRREIAALADKIVLMITEHAEPEHRFAIAREMAEDIDHRIRSGLKLQYGRVFDRLIDGPPWGAR